MRCILPPTAAAGKACPESWARERGAATTPPARRRKMTSMSLAHGRDHLAIPGPSVIPSRVLRAMHRPAPNIYEGELVSLTERAIADLAALAGTRTEPVIYIGNGHAAWEASLVNVLARGERALALLTGRFGLGWARTGRALGIEVETLDFGDREPADPARVEAALRADTDHRIRAVTTVLTDTATGVRNDIGAIRAAIEAAGHPALLMVDAICSFGCETLRLDDWGVDVMIAGCQKGLMTPPGLAFLFAGPRALAARRALGAGSQVTPYWDLLPRVEPSMFPERFCGTPPTHHLFALREALDMLLEEGIEQVWARHRALARAVWAAVDAWGAGGEIACHVPEPAHRSFAVTTVRTAAGDAPRLRRWCEREVGVTLGVGLDLGTSASSADALFRIGHMGHLNPPMLLGTLASIDTALKALGIAHGHGALDAAAAALAESAGEARDERAG